jgi:hypothetical protein
MKSALEQRFIYYCDYLCFMVETVPFMGIFGSSKELEILQFLVAEPEDFYNISSLAEILDMHRDTVSRILRKFAQYNLVSHIEVGRAKCFRLNGESKTVRSLDLLTAGILDDIGPDMNLFEHSINLMYPEKPSIQLKSKVSNILCSVGDYLISFNRDDEISPYKTRELPQEITVDTTDCSGVQMGGTTA